MSREPDALLDVLDRAHAQMLIALHAVATAREGKPALDAIHAQLSALADAEGAVLWPAFTRVAMRPETERLLGDFRDHRDEQLSALAVLARPRQSRRQRTLRALALADLVQRDAAQQANQLIAVLRCQLARPVYGALAKLFAARLHDHVVDHAHDDGAATAAQARRAG